MQRLKKACCGLIAISSVGLFSFAAQGAEPLQAVQIYSQDELLNLIKENAHLSRVKLDDCQLVQDIEARASIMKLPSYQFLYGDMLAYGVCVKKNVELGMYYMRQAADQGLPEGLEQLGRYYHIGRFVQADSKKAIMFLREAASMGNLNARLRLVEMFVAGEGSPHDYEDAYRWLNSSIIGDKQQHKKVQTLLAQLAEKMPPRIVERAKR